MCVWSRNEIAHKLFRLRKEKAEVQMGTAEGPGRSVNHSQAKGASFIMDMSDWEKLVKGRPTSPAHNTEAFFRPRARG